MSDASVTEVTDVQYKEQVVNKLNEEISQINSEMARCEKAKKGWKVATVIGGVGVAATGAAAIVQATKLNKSGKSENKPANSQEKTEDKK